MTLRCTNCGSYALEITSQSYSDNGDAFEGYECENCTATGSLRHDASLNRTTLSGAIESDGE